MKPFRTMLEPAGKGDSYMVVHVSPDDGAVAIKLADCSRIIQWWFGLPGSPHAVRKITKVKAVVDRVYAHLTGVVG